MIDFEPPGSPLSIWDVLVVTFSFSVFSSSLNFKALICFNSTLDTTWVFYFVDCLLLFLIFSQLSPQKNMYPWSVFSPSLLQVSALLWFLINHETSRFFDSLIDSFCPWCFHNFHTRRICTLVHWNGEYVPLTQLSVQKSLPTGKYDPERRTTKICVFCNSIVWQILPS